MALQRILSTIIPSSFLFLVTTLLPSPFAFGQDLSKTVLAINQLKLLGPGLKVSFGTGFCLDLDCRLVGTNYHVAKMARPRKIKGQKVIQRYFATGPDDDGATLNDAPLIGPLKYTLSRDLAIFELRSPVPQYHGIAFSLNDLQIGQEVDIYAYPLESINPVRKLLRFHGSFQGETTNGLLAFDYSPADGKSIRPGASGGLIVDSKTQQAVGVLNAIAISKRAIALAVPIQSLADFVGKVQPWLAQTLFPSAKKETISPASADVYPEFVPLSVAAYSLQHRTDESPEIKELRQKAQHLSDSIRNFIAVQTLAWGSGNKPPAAVAAYEVQVVDGFQRFREYPDGKEELENVPYPPLNTSLVPGGEWSDLPQMVGTELKLKIHQFPDTTVNGRRIKVFQYHADIEDALEQCTIESRFDFGLFSVRKTKVHPCYGEVWTDDDMNILRVSEHLGESRGSYWGDFSVVVTYGWLRQKDDVPRLIPLTISMQSETKKKVYWCRGLFTNYRVFSSKSRIVASDYTQSLPP